MANDTKPLTRKEKEQMKRWWILYAALGFFGCIFFLWLVAANAVEVWWLHDTHHNTNVIKDTTDWIHMNTEPPVANSTCDDGNECTFDGYAHEVCHNYNLPNGENCTSTCFSGSPTCQSGTCTGTCLGSCTIDADCPTVATILATNMTATCYNSVCTYNTTALDTEIQAPPCSFDSLDAETCLSVVAEDTYRECLTAHPHCTTQGPPSNLVCIYTFACADPEILLIV